MEKLQPYIDQAAAFASRQAKPETLAVIGAAFVLGYMIRAMISRHRRKLARREARGW